MGFYGPGWENLIEFVWKKICKGTFDAHFGSGNRSIWTCEKTKGLNLQLVYTYCLQNGYTILCFWTLVLPTHDVKLGKTNVLGVAGQFGGKGTLLLLQTYKIIHKIPSTRYVIRSLFSKYLKIYLANVKRMAMDEWTPTEYRFKVQTAL